jgi:hypothetical protein
MGNDFSKDDISLEHLLRYISESDRLLGFLGDAVPLAYAKRSRQRSNFYRKDFDFFAETVWGRLYSSPDVSNPLTPDGKNFRRCFRIDYESFRDVLVPFYKNKDIFDSTRAFKIPIEFKIMVALQILGHYNDCDSVSPM